MFPVGFEWLVFLILLVLVVIVADVWAIKGLISLVPEGGTLTNFQMWVIGLFAPLGVFILGLYIFILLNRGSVSKSSKMGLPPL